MTDFDGLNDNRLRLMPDKASRDRSLTIETAEKVFSWRDVHEQDGKFVGKKQDKIGVWRRTEVPDYANDPIQSIFVESRMKQLGRWERYLKELSRLGSATPRDRCKAALKALWK